MRNEGNRSTQMMRNLTLMHVSRQRVGQEIILQVIHIILQRRFRSCARVPRSTEYDRFSVKKINQRSNAQLRGSCITPWVGNTSRLRNRRTLGQLRKSVGPCIIESIVGGKVYNHALGADSIEGFNEWLANAVGESEHPAVDVLVQLGDIFWRKILVYDFALVVSFEFLPVEFSGRDMAQVHEGVVVEEVDQGLASVSPGADEANSRGDVVGGILLSEGWVRVSCDDGVA